MHLNVLNLHHFQNPNITFINYMFSQNPWYILRLPFFFDLDIVLIYFHNEPILDIYVLRDFQWYKECCNPMGVLTPEITFWRFKSPSGIQFPKWEFTWECGGHSLTLSYTPRSMKCDSWASLLARTLVNSYFGHEPKVRVVTFLLNQITCLKISWYIIR
jgi:hypothetical protein